MSFSTILPKRMPERADLGQTYSDVLQRWPQRAQQDVAGFGGRYRAGRARQKPDLQTLFEPSHRVAQRRLRHAKP
jgi:hypothetical protein